MPASRHALAPPRCYCRPRRQRLGSPSFPRPPCRSLLRRCRSPWSFAVLLLGLLLSPRAWAASALVAYLAGSAAGLPVFAPRPHGRSRPRCISRTRAGYLVAYPFAAALISVLWRINGRGAWAALPCAAAGNLLILVSGAIWLAVFTHASAQAVFAIGVLPFLAADALKVGAAAALAAGLRRLSHRAN